MWQRFQWRWNKISDTILIREAFQRSTVWIWSLRKGKWNPIMLLKTFSLFWRYWSVFRKNQISTHKSKSFEQLATVSVNVSLIPNIKFSIKSKLVLKQQKQKWNISFTLVSSSTTLNVHENSNWSNVTLLFKTDTND